MTAVSIAHPSARTELVGSPRPGLGSGRRGGPPAHPGRGVSTAYAAPSGRALRGCRLPDAPAASWRLTDRGVAVVLVIGLMIMVAALTVIGLTAVRVTGPDYRPDVASLAQLR
jgi:hypothetical protein